ncbi:CbiX/SirB N-terminal domain-containing protein [Schlegelella sp. S2-27]|uniref:CbiX/SirB N-terminal domain-containing protein n=1 Tax=Caldimonas mangrovi TaxID=2944811 RepID=A0ABT0YMR7_9BURK|nr:CbiX/SirB N-terminal domain-containing protein [Caldimonas mangrovi]MCM5680021.1 CbiX/SirB N-terminal domain-containing protein [Caldimonas mangrovi]
MCRPGILLFAHGARDPQWARPFDATAQRLRGLAPDAVVELAFLEFMSPDLQEAGARLAAAGCTHVSVVPLFLGAGGHVRKDLPALLAELAGRHPHVQWLLQPAVGETERLIEAMAQSALALSRTST